MELALIGRIGQAMQAKKTPRNNNISLLSRGFTDVAGPGAGGQDQTRQTSPKPSLY